MILRSTSHDEHSEKETASRTHEHSKDKCNMSIVPRAYQTICTFGTDSALYENRCTDNVNWYGHSRTMHMGVRKVRVLAFDRYGYGRTVGTATGVVRAFKGNFTITRTRANLSLLESNICFRPWNLTCQLRCFFCFSLPAWSKR